MSEDAVVIGGGLGGISAAVSLAADGFDVRLVEKNGHLGGKLNLLEKDGFSFDLGPSILTLPHIFRSLFNRAGADLDEHVDLRELDLQWRSFFEDGTCIDLYNEIERTREENAYVTDEHVRQMESFLDYSGDIYEVTEQGYFSAGLDTLWDFVWHYSPFSIMSFDYFSTVDQGVRRHIKDEKLADIFNFFIKYVGSSPYDAPAMLNLLPYVQQEYGLWYVDGGLYNLARGLRELLDIAGVEVHLNTEVKQLNLENETARGVTLDDGSTMEATYVVSNMEVIPLYDHLVDRDVPGMSSYRDWYEPSCSGLVMHLGLDRTYDQLDHHNFFFSNDPKDHFNSVFQDYKLPYDPTIYVVAPAQTDPSVSPEGCENLKILPHIPHMDEDGDFSEEAYDQFEDRILTKLERMGLENLRDHIIVEETLYPHDIQQMYYSNKGAIYGVVSDQSNSALKAPKESEYFDRLYFTGGSVNPGPGMPMVTLCGQLVADQISEDAS
jgi:diapolycopene oxygenase